MGTKLWTSTDPHAYAISGVAEVKHNKGRERAQLQPGHVSAESKEAASLIDEVSKDAHAKHQINLRQQIKLGS